MVDSITPATDDALRQRVADECNIFDAWPIQRESFRQFVIEDFGSSDLPDFSAVGAQITDKVHGYEAAKLRLLNGAHSTLAYVGILRNLETVHDAMQDHYLSGLIEAMMRFDIAPTLQPAAGLDLEIYIQDILNRFRNPAIRHLLSQIAWDGSKKLPIRLLDTIRDVLARGATIERLVIPIAAWMHFIRKRTNDRDVLVDPLAEMLGTLARRTNGTAEIDVPMFLDIAQIFDPELAVHPEFQQQIIQAYRNLL
jgi:fructuronate reductase